MITKTLAAAALVVTATAATAQSTSPVYEIAIQEIKSGDEADWAEKRGAFLGLLADRSGNEKDWTLKSFFTFPEPGPLPVYVGVTRWSSIDDFKRASEALLPTGEAQAFFETVDLQAFTQISPLDGKSFVLEGYINQPGQVLEFAVRRAKEGMETEFEATRDAFFTEVAKQDGYVFDREFVTSDGWRAVLIGWDSQDHFMKALGALSQSETMGAFFGTIDSGAYQATVFE